MLRREMMKKSLMHMLAAAVIPFLTLAVPSQAASAAPVQDIRAMLSSEFGLSDITIKIDGQELLAQSALDNKVEFRDAVRQAVKSFLEDGADEESPRAILGNILWPQNDPAALTKELKARLNKSGTVLTLLKTGEVPEYGESVRTHWIFRLSHDMSDHLNWAVVARSGLKPAYNYGFN